MSDYNEEATCEHGTTALSLVCGLCIEQHEDGVGKELAELRGHLGRYAEQIVSLRKQLAEVYEAPIGAAVKELAELRAYRDRTEAALVKLARLPMRKWFSMSLRALGLWRDPPKEQQA